MGLEKSTLSRNTGRLVDRGWVEMRDHPDGRGALLTVTASGKETLVRALPAWNEAQARARSLVIRAGDRRPATARPRDRATARPRDRV